MVRLAATGMTNREIGASLYLSPRTVGAHLYNAFPKLGVTSRAQLRDIVEAREPHCSPASGCATIRVPASASGMNAVRRRGSTRRRALRRRCARRLASIRPASASNLRKRGTTLVTIQGHRSSYRVILGQRARTRTARDPAGERVEVERGEVRRPPAACRAPRSSWPSRSRSSRANAHERRSKWGCTRARCSCSRSWTLPSQISSTGRPSSLRGRRLVLQDPPAPSIASKPARTAA